jgi:hypothetical protein
VAQDFPTQRWRKRLGMPAMRISRFVNAAKHVFNFDQAAVRVRDETAGTAKTAGRSNRKRARGSEKVDGFL